MNVDEAVARALAECGLDPSCARTIRDLVERRDEEWHACCGSQCEPCVVVLVRAVERVRALLEAR